MGTAATAMRRRGIWVAMVAALAVGGCEQFDPVASDNLCERDDGHAISMLCPQCATMPFAWNCSSCFKMGNPDPEMCEPRITIDPATGAGRGGGGGRGGESAGEGGDGSEAGEGGQSGPGGEGGESGEGGAGEGGAGSGGMSGGPEGGAGGGPMVDPLTCIDDLWCATKDPTLPACKMGRCVECTRNDHCMGEQGVCNTDLNRCQTCVDDDDCAVGRCNATLKVCVECQADGDCTDPIKDSCDTSRFVCVDCTGVAGCEDEVADKTTCYTSAQTCVDCLEDTDCNEDKPACNKTTRECVGCITDGHCTTDPVKGSCDPGTRTCVDCINNTGCAGGPNPQCDTEAHVCVECLVGSHCASGNCYENQCVECLEDEDCPSATASRCDQTTHMCVGCTSSANCEHLEDTPACSNRRCVECNDDGDCNGFACIRAQHVCSDVRVRSRGVCNECQADSMCMQNMYCVPLQFDSATYGNHCVPIRSSQTGSSCANARPYSQAANLRSIDGMSQAYCIPPSRTTCPGVLDATVPLGGQTCGNTSECGLGRDDAICNGDGRCTYGCISSNDCPVQMNCLAGGSCGAGQ